MKKLIVLLCVFALSFCFCACDKEENANTNVGEENVSVGNVEPDVEVPADESVNEEAVEIKLPSADDKLNGLGNTYLSDGYAVTDGEWIYYRSYSDGSYSMKKMSMDGTTVEQLPGGNLWWIDIEDGFLYGSYKKQNIVKVDIADRKEYKYSRRQDLNEYNSYYITVDNGWIYYCTNDTQIDKNGVYKMKTDGTENTLLYEGVVDSFKLDGEWLYIDDYDTHYRIKTDGTGLEQLPIGALKYDYIVSNGVFFDKNGKYEDASLVGNSGKGVPSHTYASLIDDTFYYIKGGSIYKQNSDGTNEVKILDGEAYSHVHVLGDWLFFMNSDTDEWYFCKTDGSGLKVVE